MPSSSSDYRGLFAPSPTGPLHFGSLVAALGSYLDAKHHHGTWLVRMEDLDTPRCTSEAADDILRTLEVYGLHWDDEVIYQSRRGSAYADALQKLKAIGAVYPCCCTRKENSALQGIEGLVYPGTCQTVFRQDAKATRGGCEQTFSPRPSLFPLPKLSSTMRCKVSPISCVAPTCYCPRRARFNCKDYCAWPRPTIVSVQPRHIDSLSES